MSMHRRTFLKSTAAAAASVRSRKAASDARGRRAFGVLTGKGAAPRLKMRTDHLRAKLVPRPPSTPNLFASLPSIRRFTLAETQKRNFCAFARAVADGNNPFDGHPRNKSDCARAGGVG